MMKKEQKKLKEVASLYGSHMAMRLATERALLAYGDKLTGKNSNHALNIHMGLYDDLTPQDFMNDPYMAPEMPKCDTRAALEAKFSIA